MTRRSRAALFAVLAAGMARANHNSSDIGDSADLLRMPLSVQYLGSGQLYGSYDLFKVFQNPALLANQPQTWEFAASNMSMFGFGQNTTSLAGGYGSIQTESGVFGFAGLFSATLVPGFEELDSYGNATANDVSPMLMRLGVAGLYQWQFVSFGAGFQSGIISYGTHPDLEGISTPIKIDVGTTLTLGRLDLGVVYHPYPADAAGIAFGVAFKGKSGWFRGFGADLDLPFAIDPDEDTSSNPTTTTTTPDPSDAYRMTLAVGGSFNPYGPLELRAGSIIWPGPGAADLRLGFGIPWKTFHFDLAFNLPVIEDNAGAGLRTMLSANYRLGTERKMSDGPKFMIGEKDRTMAVSSFDPQNVSAGDAAVISDMMRNQLIKEGAFNIVEKANMDKVLGEQAFQQTGCTTQECAVKLGKILNVKYLVVGSFGKALDQYVLSLRVIDVETAKAVYSDESYGANIQEVRSGITTLASNLTKAVQGKK